MLFDIIRSLKLKPAASDESAPLPPLSFTFTLTNPEVGIGGETSSIKPESCRSIDSLHQSFARTIYMGSICIVSVIITRQLIPWYNKKCLAVELYHSVLYRWIMATYLSLTLNCVFLERSKITKRLRSWDPPRPNILNSPSLPRPTVLEWL